AALAKLPYPGLAIPGAFAFTPDGRAVTYLKSDSAGLDQVFWRLEISDGTSRIVARPPDSGNTEANLSEVEKLRRERQRLRETGITHIARAEGADVAVTPLRGNLYVQQGAGPLEPITDSASPQLDPKLSRDGSRVAFVRNDELYALDLASGKE